MGHKYKKRHRKWRTVGERELVVLYTRIDGEHKTAIAPSLLEETEGLPWLARIDWICAKTGMAFSDVRREIDGQARSDF